MTLSEFARIADREARRARLYPEDESIILNWRFADAVTDMVKANRETGFDDSNIFWIMDLVGITGSKLSGYRLK